MNTTVVLEVYLDPDEPSDNRLMVATFDTLEEAVRDAMARHDADGTHYIIEQDTIVEDRPASLGSSRLHETVFRTREITRVDV